MSSTEDDVVWLSVEEPEPQPRRPLGFYAAIGLGLLVCVGAGLAVIMKAAALVAERSRPISITRPLSVEEVYRESSRVFSDYDGAERTGDPEQVALQRLFDTLAGCAASNDDDAFKQLVDRRRLQKLLERKDAYRGLSFFDKSAIRQRVFASLEVEPFWCNPTIAGILTPPDDPQSRVVYILSGYSNGDSREMESRFLVARDGEEWKLYDWRRLDLGLAESDFFTRWIHTTLASTEDRFSRWLEAIGEADAALGEGDTDSAEAALQRAEQTIPESGLHDYCRVLTGYRWQAAGLNEGARKCFQQVKEPNLIAGAHYALSGCLENRSPSEALHYAKSYTALVGPTPDSCRHQAELLDQLGRDAEARSMWREVLRGNPSNVRALSQVLRGYADDEKGQIIPLLERLPNPAEAAELLGWILPDDYAGLGVLVDFLRKRAPNLAGTHAAIGAQRRADGQFAEATKCYLSAIQAAEDPSAYFDDYFNAAGASGDLASAFAALPDQATAFEHLAYSIDSGDIDASAADFRELTRLRFEAAPNDPSVVHRWADALQESGQTEEAEALLRKQLRSMQAVSEDDVYLRNDLNLTLATLLSRSNRWGDAYALVEGNTGTFEALVRNAAEDRRTKALRQLIALGNRDGLPRSTLAFAEGRLATIEKRPDDALNHYRVAKEAADEYERWSYNSSYLAACVRAGKWRRYYDGADDSAEAFRRLSDSLIESGDWRTLEALHKAHRNHPSADSDIALSHADAAWERDEWVQYLRHIKTIDQTTLDALPYYQAQAHARRRIVASCRAGKYTEALRLAEVQGDHAHVAATHALRGNTTSAQRAARRAATSDMNLWGVYQNEVAGRVFLGPSYSELHRDFPVSLPYQGIETLAVFYAEDATPLQPSDVRDAVERLPDDTSSELARILTAGRRVRWAVASQYGDAVVWVAHAGETPYDAYRAKDAAATRASVMNRTGNWVAVGVAGWDQTQRDATAPIARRLVAALFEGRAGVVRLDSEETYYLAHAYENQSELLRAWRDRDDLIVFDDRRISLEYTREADTEPCDREFRDSLFEVLHEIERGSRKRLLVAAEPPNVGGFGAVWIEVDRIHRQDGSLSFVGPMREDSPLLTDLRKGLNVKAFLPNVVAWRWSDDTSVTTWRCAN